MEAKLMQLLVIILTKQLVAFLVETQHLLLKVAMLTDFQHLIRLETLSNEEA